MDNRYHFIDQSGKARGPVWLAEMRRLFQAGEIHPETLVCREGETEWDPARVFPEITERMATAPLDQQDKSGNQPSISIGVWILVLICALFMWKVSQWLLHD